MSAVCGFLGCENATRGEYPWQMCDPCADHAWEVEDSNLHYIDDVASELGVIL